MTAYSTILDAQIDVASPFTEALMTQIRDNPIAMAEGAAGAPKIAMDALEVLAAGTTARYAGTYSVTQSGTSYITMWDGVAFVQSGVVRVGYELKNASGSLAYGQVSLNGVSQSILTTSSTSYVAKSVDITVSVGDVLSMEMRSTSGTSSTMRNPTLKTNGERIFPLTADPYNFTNA